MHARNFFRVQVELGAQQSPCDSAAAVVYQGVRANTRRAKEARAIGLSLESGLRGPTVPNSSPNSSLNSGRDAFVERQQIRMAPSGPPCRSTLPNASWDTAIYAHVLQLDLFIIYGEFFQSGIQDAKLALGGTSSVEGI